MAVAAAAAWVRAGPLASQQVAACVLVCIPLVEGHEISHRQQLEGRLRGLQLPVQLPS